MIREAQKTLPLWYYDNEGNEEVMFIFCWCVTGTEEMLHAELYTYTSYVVTVVMHDRAKLYPPLVL